MFFLLTGTVIALYSLLKFHLVLHLRCIILEVTMGVLKVLHLVFTKWDLYTPQTRIKLTN